MKTPGIPTSVLVAGDGIAVSGRTIGLTSTFYGYLNNAGSADGVVVSDSSNEIAGIFVPRADTQTNYESVTPNDGEIASIQTTHGMRLGDGSTAGGIDFALNSDSCVTVAPRRTGTTSWTALMNGVEKARALTPNGSAVSATNPVTVVVLPGVYEGVGGADPLLIDTEGLRIIGIGGSAVTTLWATGTAGLFLKLSANNTTLQGFTLLGPSTSVGPLWWFATASAGIVHRDLNFVLNAATGGCVLWDSTPTVLAGLYENCRTNGGALYGAKSFSGGVTATFRNCRANGSSIYASFGGSASPTVPNVFNGLIDNCRSVHTGRIKVASLGEVKNSAFGSTTDEPCIFIDTNGVIHDCQFSALGTAATAVAIGTEGAETPTAPTWNLAIKPGTGSETDPGFSNNYTNSIASPGNVVDSALPTIA